MNDMNRINEENRKAIGPYLLIILAAAIIGAIVGCIISNGEASWEGVAQNMNHFMKQICFYLQIVTVIFTLLFGLISYFRAKALYRTWDPDSDDEEMEIPLPKRISKWIDISIAINSMCLILSYLFFGMTIYYSELHSREALYNYQLPVSLFLFLLGAFLCTIQQQKAVDLCKQMEPEKKGSVYDMRFSKKWMESCDEAQKLKVYRAGYTSFVVTKHCCSALMLLTFLGNMMFHWTVVPMVVVAIIWSVNTISYCIAGYRLE